MRHDEVFPADYAEARERFRQAAPSAAWTLTSSPVDTRGPDGGPLTTDVLASGEQCPERTLIVSSGLHGVEGFFGSAVLVGALRSVFSEQGPPTGSRIVLVHALNPWGFAHRRRTDEHNVDPNRNFLVRGQIFRGCAPEYERLNDLLNPRHPPRRFDMFTVRAMAAISRSGLRAVKQAVAAGQYEHPHGLFFGGRERSSVARHFMAMWPDWTRHARSVLHLDIHTGLGRSGRCKLLSSESPDDEHTSELTDLFGSGLLEFAGSSGVAYEAQGDLGRWCRECYTVGDYCYLCAEFGTRSSLRVLAALRAENQAHHFSSPSDPARARAKHRLLEAFCPSSPRFRTRALNNALQIIRQAFRWLDLPGE